MGAVREAAKAATRETVLTAARRVFEEAGYEAATIRLIACRAGLSTGAVFSHFSGKALLYEAVYDHAPLTPEDGRRLLNEVAELRSLLAVAGLA